MREGHYRIQGENNFTGGKLQVNALRQYILVAGIHYETGNSFDKYCNDYKAKIIAKNRGMYDLTFIIVDFKGTIETIENGRSVSIKNFDRISITNYPNKRDFSSLGKSNYISKKNIYELVEKIGLNKPGTLQELNIFSHAFSGGPVLVNSSESGDIDLDMRRSDFEKNIFNLENFHKAFTNDGMVKIWGCQSHSAFNYLLKRIMQDPKYKKDGSTPDTEEFIVRDIPVEKKWLLSEYIPPDCFIKLSDNRIMLTMLQAKKIFAHDYCNNFAAFLTFKVDIKVQYALPATYASFGSPDLFRISDDTKMNVKFYEKYLVISIGELDYGIYDKTTVVKYVKLYFPSL